jgi:hypothetical protein
MQTTRHPIHRLALACALVLALLAGPAAASAAATTRPAAAIRVPTSENNARWPREPASGPLPAVTAPPTNVSRHSQPRDWTLISVGAGLLILVAVTGVATGVRVRPRRRVAA